MVSEPIVWIINSQHWPRALLRAELIGRGYETVGYVEIAHALAAFNNPYVTKPHMIVLELCEQTIKRKDVEELVHTGVPVIILGGIVELSEKLIGEFRWVAVIRHPCTIGEVADVVQELISLDKR